MKRSECRTTNRNASIRRTEQHQLSAWFSPNTDLPTLHKMVPGKDWPDQPSLYTHQPVIQKSWPFLPVKDKHHHHRRRRRHHHHQSINQSVNQSNFHSANIPAKPGSVVRQPNQCSTAKSRKQLCNINRP